MSVYRDVEHLNWKVNENITYEERAGWKRNPAETCAAALGNCTDIALYKLQLINQMQQCGEDVSGHLERCWLDNTLSEAHMVCVVQLRVKPWWRRHAKWITYVMDNRTDFLYEKEDSGYRFLDNSSNRWTYKEALEMLK